MKAVVNANLFRIVYTTVSTEETRYYLNGVHIEPHHEKGVLIVSTDGRRMLVAHDPDGECDESAIIALPKFVLAQCKTPTMFYDRRVLEIDGTPSASSASLVDLVAYKDKPAKRDMVITAHRVLIDGTFPAWRRIVPAEIPGASSPAAFDPKYMAAWAKVGKDLGDKPLHVKPSDGVSATVVRFSGADNVFGVQMPMRDNVSGFLPAFMSQPKSSFRRPSNPTSNA